MNILAIMCGGALGALMRHLLVLAFPLSTKWHITPGIFFANLGGCLLFGFFHQVLLEHPSTLWRFFLLTGIMGSLTTFSTYMFEILQARNHSWTMVFLIALAHLIACFIGLLLGQGIAKVTL